MPLIEQLFKEIAWLYEATKSIDVTTVYLLIEYKEINALRSLADKTWSSPFNILHLGLALMALVSADNAHLASDLCLP